MAWAAAIVPETVAAFGGPLVLTRSAVTVAALLAEIAVSADFGAVSVVARAAVSVVTAASVAATAVDIAERRRTTGDSYGPAVS
jgi:hypothetical protein